LRITNSLDHRRIQARALRNQALHTTIRPLHTTVGADGDDGILH
jgi:hypothetical protein